MNQIEKILKVRKANEELFNYPFTGLEDTHPTEILLRNELYELETTECDETLYCPICHSDEFIIPYLENGEDPLTVECELCQVETKIKNLLKTLELNPFSGNDLLIRKLAIDRKYGGPCIS